MASQSFARVDWTAARLSASPSAAATFGASVVFSQELTQYPSFPFRQIERPRCRQTGCFRQLLPRGAERERRPFGLQHCDGRLILFRFDISAPCG